LEREVLGISKHLIANLYSWRDNIYKWHYSFHTYNSIVCRTLYTLTINEKSGTEAAFLFSVSCKKWMDRKDYKFKYLIWVLWKISSEGTALSLFSGLSFKLTVKNCDPTTSLKVGEQTCIHEGTIFTNGITRFTHIIG
jgi:hypothetical protein